MEHINEPIRVLHILTGLTTGGAESFILNMYRNIDRSKVQFDFLLRSNDNIYKDELEAMGSRVYVTASFPRHFIQNALQTAAFFKTHHYDIIHVHANALLYTFALSCAKRNGVKCRIIHSHNAAMAHMQLLSIHNANKRRIHDLATDFFACSEDAGKWMFNNKFKIVHNAINLEAFAFDSNKRAQIRTNLGIQNNELVIGHIGRFAEQKNHSFLIDVFAEVTKTKPDAKLVLIGDGELRCSIEEKVKRLNLRNQVIFLGAQRRVADFINSFDLCVFPSLYEGLPLSILEVQANGLKVICSEGVPDEVLFDSSMRKISLDVAPSDWASLIVNIDTQRLQLTDKLQAAGYNVEQEAQKLQNFYLSKVK